jgi:hypothetical protein
MAKGSYEQNNVKTTVAGEALLMTYFTRQFRANGQINQSLTLISVSDALIDCLDDFPNIANRCIALTPVLTRCSGWENREKGER